VQHVFPSAEVGALRPNRKLEKVIDQLTAHAARKCQGLPDLPAAFPGACGTGDLDDLLSCIGLRAVCGACTSLNAFDALSINCDLVDD